MQIDPKDVDAVCDMVLDLCGIYLDASKSYLMESRLGAIARKHECDHFRELVDRVRCGSSLKLKNDIIDAITTNETLFFRDQSPFEAFKYKALPELIDAKQGSARPKKLRIWSAAASTGQEPYSIAISTCEMIPDWQTWDIQILGTDISDAAIAKASRGRYTDSEVERGMPTPLLNRYFQRDRDGWTIKDEIRSMISFRTFNLLDSFTALGSFDFIFCRNVAIYFTPEVRESLFERLTHNITPDGYLFVGATEILKNLGPQFAPQHHCGSVFYRPHQACSN